MAWRRQRQVRYHHSRRVAARCHVVANTEPRADSPAPTGQSFARRGPGRASRTRTLFHEGRSTSRRFWPEDHGVLARSQTAANFWLHPSVTPDRRTTGRGAAPADIGGGRAVYGRSRVPAGAPYPDLTAVRMHRVQTLTRLATPSTIIVLRWMLGTNKRFVRRLEKLTLRPKVVCLPHTSHLPAIIGAHSLDPMSTEQSHHTRATARHRFGAARHGGRNGPNQVGYPSTGTSVEQRAAPNAGRPAATILRRRPSEAAAMPTWRRIVHPRSSPWRGRWGGAEREGRRPWVPPWHDMASGSDGPLIAGRSAGVAGVGWR